MTATPESRRAQAKLAVSTRERGPDHPETVAAQQEFRSERYLARIRTIVADAPPVSDMSDEQRNTLRSLLAPVVEAVVQAGQ